jgi:hypothetical protein
LEPHVLKEIDAWIKKNIVELSIDIERDKLMSDHEEFTTYLMEEAAVKLAKRVVLHQNIHPEWKISDDCPTIRCRLNTLTFKNDYGF